MTSLDEILDTELLARHIEDGNVSARTHEKFPWEIFNYTPKAQFARAWDDVTLACRGLVWNYETNTVLARPFPKFFNWDEGVIQYPPIGHTLRMEKMDGSLGILVTDDYCNGTPTKEWISTRGSFHSEQAEWATKFYLETVAESANNLPPEMVFSPLQGKTYLFEIIYPENRIVVDYGDYKGLVLLDVIDNETGNSDVQEFDKAEWPDKVKRILANFDSGDTAAIPDGDEGFVYLWTSRKDRDGNDLPDFRTKMKSPDYIALHRLVTGLSEKTVWEHMVKGGALQDLKRELPEEFHEFIDNAGKKFLKEASQIVSTVYSAIDTLESTVLHERLDMVDRKTAAVAIQKHFPALAKYMFLVLDGRPIHPVALLSVKPRKEAPLVTEV